MTRGLPAGTVALVDFGATVGREQSGIRPAVILSSGDFAEAIDRLAIVVPCSRTQRGWPNHVELQGSTGLTHTTIAMTEQPRTLATERILRPIGTVDNATLETIIRWVRTWIAPPAA